MARKRLLVCCDGTWNNLEMRYITNVGRIVQVAGSAGKGVDGKRIEHALYYDDGVGADDGGLQRAVQGAFGVGIDRLIFEAYRFIAINHQPGDEVCLFGFSRGAFVARSVAGMIGKVGLVPRRKLKYLPRAMDAYRSKKEKDQEAFRAEAESEVIDITLLGCWDTVGALGIPDKLPFVPIDNWFRKRYEFHDTVLGAHVQRALHAVAIDERRKEFRPTLMERPAGAPASQVLVQTWFPGDHGSVGGGSWEKRGLSNHCLCWMLDQAKTLGVDLGADLGCLHDHAITDHRIFFSRETKIIYATADRKIPDTVTYADVDPTARSRWADHDDYRPPALQRSFGDELNREPTTVKHPPSNGRLRVRGTAEARVTARIKENPTGVMVQAGEAYEIEVGRTQVWKDGDLDPCDVRGWSTTDPAKVPYEGGKQVEKSAISSWLIRRGDRLKLHRPADWFELVCRIGDEGFVPIRVVAPAEQESPFVMSFTANADGELVLAANDASDRFDLLDKYDNNAGWVWVTIRRTS